MANGLTGWFWGYDPGGHEGNGVAAIYAVDGVLQTDKTLIRTKNTAAEVVTWFKDQKTDGAAALAMGIDTLTCWSGGNGGWRRADHALRSAYPTVKRSVMSPSTLMGAMGLNGMFVLLRLRQCDPNLYITETHPKVLHAAMKGKPYKTILGHSSDWLEDKVEKWLMPLGLCTSSPEKTPKNSHEVDALISAYAAFQAFSAYKNESSEWRLDLFCAKNRRELLSELKQELVGARKRPIADTSKEDLEFPTNPLKTGESGPVEYRWPHPRSKDHTKP